MMDLDDDLDAMLSTDEFADEITLPDLSVINGIYDTDFIEVDDDGAMVSSFQPNALVKTSDISSLAIGNDITINGTTYDVRDIQPDAKGSSLLILYEQ